ncbi:MAG: ribosome small subunit-dependent GTPase A [Chlamydiales bacterium]
MNDEHHLEKAFRHQEKKDIRRQRQIASSKDRSKYKKTDQKKAQKRQAQAQQEAASREDLERGRVIAIKSEGIIVAGPQGTITCTLRGVLKKERTQQKNLVTVGDFVRFEPLGEQEGAIHSVEERTSSLSRADTLWQKQEQLIAANIDQVLITTSVVIPPLKPSLIDRYLIAARKGNMEPILLINKIDLLKDREEEFLYFHECCEAYRKAGFPLIPLSCETDEGLDTLKEVMKGRASVFAGQSGVGKSSLINAVTGLSLAVGAPVERTKKGAHTTTTSELIPLEQGGWCIDTPGIKSFGMWNLEAEEIQDYYPEFSSLREHCRFPNCTHTHEPDCAVREAWEEDKLHPIRYESYLSLFETLQEEHRPR